MELLKALEIIIKDNTKKAVSKEFNGYIYNAVSTEVANDGKHVIAWNDGSYIRLTERILSTEWEIQDYTTEEQENNDIVTYINNQLGSSYESINEINYVDIIDKYRYKLSEEFIDRIIRVNDNNIWYDIIEFQTLSENFIRKYSDIFDKSLWGYIVQYQTLSEEFMLEYQNKMNWYDVSSYQNFGEEFALKFKDKLYWYTIIRRNMFPMNFYITNIDILENDDFGDLFFHYPEFATMFRDYIKNLN